MTLLVTSGAVIGCGKASIPGKYVNQDNPSEYLELNEDGTYYLKEMGVGFDGEWEVKGNELRLHFAMGLVATAEIQGNKLYDEDGKVWVKRQTDATKPVTPAVTIQKSSTDDIEWLATVIASEAGSVWDSNKWVGCSDEERAAVGWTVINRLNKGTFGETIEKVATSPGQYAHNQQSTEEIKALAKKLLEGQIPDATGGATHFFSPISMPKQGEPTTGFDVGGGLSEVSGITKKVYFPSWTKTFTWVGDLKNIRRAYFMLYRPTIITDEPFTEMLKLIPDSSEMRSSVYLNDYARVRTAYDIPLPGPDVDDKAVETYLQSVLSNELTGNRTLAPQTFISGFMSPYAFVSPIKRKNIGFGPQDVDRDISAGMPPNILEAAKGRYEPAVIADALNRYGYEAKGPHTEEYGGALVYDMGYDGNKINLVKRLSPPFFDNVGRVRQLGVQEGYVFRAVDTETIKMMIDARRGLVNSLADNPYFNVMGAALWEMGVYSAFLTDQPANLEWMTPEEKVLSQQASNAETLLGPYRTWSAGVGKDEEGFFTVIVLVYDEARQASSDATILKKRIDVSTYPSLGRPWRDLVDRVWADGRTLRMLVRADLPATWYGSGMYYWSTLLLQR